MTLAVLLPYIMLGAFILFAYTAEAMTGFGSIVIALSLGALFFPIDFLQTVLVPLNICMSSFLTFKYRRYIDWTLLGKLIMPFMLGGTLLGFVLQPYLGGVILKASFALLVLWFAVRELLKARGGIVATEKPVWWSRGVIGMAGITHGLFASGGPLLVYGLAGMSIDKARFRATLILVWFSLNSVLTVLFLIDGRIQANWQPIVAFMPLLPLGVWIGERLHHKVDEDSFKLWIYRVLVLSALALLLSSLMPLLPAL
jgi:uncharacterized membrane protein YfcA